MMTAELTSARFDSKDLGGFVGLPPSLDDWRRGILETASTPDPQRNAAAQKIGDYYSSCTDEKTVDRKGAEPLKPALDRIATIDSKKQIADGAAAMVQGGMLFRFGSTQDFRDASQMIAEADQGGLGLPDRDYYTKQDPKSVDLRKAYVAHVQKIFQLLGDQPEVAATEAQTVMRIETALAQGSMTRVERTDSFAMSAFEPTAMIRPTNSWPTTIGTGMVFWAQASQL